MGHTAKKYKNMDNLNTFKHKIEKWKHFTFKVYINISFV